MPAENAAAVGALVKIYWTATGEVHALKGIDAHFPKGEVTAVVGPSGSGKSSLLRILVGLDRPTGGSVMIGGREISGSSQPRLHRLRRRQIGYVFQRPADNLLAHLPVATQVEHTARLRGVNRDRAHELLDQLGLGGRTGHMPHQLSGGEQQRVAFAQAAIGDPVLLVADEPTAELDSDSSASVLGVVTALARRGVAVVVATHDPQVVEAADRTLHLRHGAVEAETSQRRQLAVIDAGGRIQLPPDALKLFPTHRAVLQIGDDEVRLTPP